MSSSFPAARNSVAIHSPDASLKPAANTRQASAPPAGAVSELPQLAHMSVGPQVLVQPDAPPDAQLLQPVSVPVAVIWAPIEVPTKIVSPTQHAVPVANLRPAIIKPNREPMLADANLSATHFPSPVPIVAGSTSPVVVRAPNAPKEMATVSLAKAELPSPARVISLSPLQATEDVVIPLVNQSIQGGNSQLATPPQPGLSGEVANKGIGAKDKSGEDTGGTASGQGRQGTPGSRVSPSAGAEPGLGSGYEGSLTHLTLAKDGQFGVVVVGSSVADEYPEVVGIWHGRLVYTVYLHVGSGKSWIMQYTVPADEEAAAGGVVTKPEAPWPYDILRPDLSESDYTADAIMVHGFVNLAGRFERLGLVFPQGFTQAKFLLDSLMQWKFRPAKQGKSLAMVEVLLIIPEEQ